MNGPQRIGPPEGASLAQPPGRQGQEPQANFLSLLDDWKARTAHAEGQTKKAAEGRRDSREADLRDHGSDEARERRLERVEARLVRRVERLEEKAQRQAHKIEQKLERQGDPAAADAGTPAAAEGAATPADAAAASVTGAAGVTATVAQAVAAEPALVIPALPAADTVVPVVAAPAAEATATAAPVVPVAVPVAATPEAAADAVAPAADKATAAVAPTAPAAPAEAGMPAVADEPAPQATDETGAPQAPAETPAGAEKRPAAAPAVEAKPAQQTGDTKAPEAARPAQDAPAPASQDQAGAGDGTAQQSQSGSGDRPAQGQAQETAAPARPATGDQSQAASAIGARGTVETGSPRGVQERSLHRAAPLHRAVESVEATLRLAAGKGVTHASLSLRPSELGSIEVRLRATADGLVATVAADAAQAAGLLQQAEGDLRRSLEDAGVRLLRLDISWNGDGRGQRDGSPAPGRQAQPWQDGGDDAEVKTPTETVLELPNGVLVDVLA
jgi:flagellar hook-length control protein FliK